MKIPAKIKIGGHVITVKEIAGFKFMGRTALGDNTITLDANMSDSRKWATLIHETIHVMNTSIDETPMGHAFMDSLSEQIYQFISDNKILK